MNSKRAQGLPTIRLRGLFSEMVLAFLEPIGLSVELPLIYWSSGCRHDIHPLPGSDSLRIFEVFKKSSIEDKKVFKFF